MENIDKFFNNIPEYYNKKRYDELIRLLLQFKSTKTNDPKLLFELGKVYFIVGNYFEAEKYLQETSNFNEFKISSLDLLGKIYKNKKNIDAVIRSYKNILEVDIKNKEAYIELINTYFYDKKKYSVALDYIDKLLLVQKDNIYANIMKIKSYTMLKKLPSEIKKNCDDIFTFTIDNKVSSDELINLSYFFMLNKQYELSIYIISFMKKYSELKKDILLLFSTFQYDFAKYIKSFRLLGEKVEEKFIKFLEQIPEYAIKIRNMIINELEIFRKEIVLKSKPRSITVVLTNRCNLKCKMCKVWENMWDMSDKNIAEIKKIMPYLEYITWHGGEVFLHKRFTELFDFAQECGIQQEIITNGLLISDDIIKKMIEYNIQLTLSIDGVDELTYEKIRHGAKFSKLINVLGNLKKHRTTQTNSSFKIRMNTIVSYDNYLSLFAFLDFAHEYNINELYLFPLIFDFNNNYDLNKFVSLYSPVIEYLEKNKSKFNKVAKDLNINIINTVPDLKNFNENIKNSADWKGNYLSLNENECISDSQSEEMIFYNKDITGKNRDQIFCTVPWQRLRLDRVIRPHCFCKGNVNIGMVDDNFDIDKIWNCDYIKAYRKMIINKDFKNFCNPSCYLGIIPEEQYNGIV